MTEDQIEVDLTADDATLEEIDPDETPDDEPPELSSERPEPTDDQDGPDSEPIAARAQREAKKRLQNAEGDQYTERVTDAVEDATVSLKEHSQQLQQLKQQRQQADQRLERLEITRDRVEEQPPDCEIVQTIAGGISFEVPPDAYHEPNGSEGTYTRGDLVDEIDETIDAIEGQLEDLDGQIESVEESLEQTQLAVQQLQSTGELLDE